MRQFAAVVGVLLASNLASAGQTIFVTSLKDIGAGNLRAAIIKANNQGGATIAFLVAGTIELQSALPPLTGGSITIDGCTAPGQVVLQYRNPGSSTSKRFDGVRVVSSGNVVRCLIVRNLTKDGISVVGSQARNNIVELNTVEDSGDDGIGVAQGAEAKVKDNVIQRSRNKGILVWNGSSAILLNNTLRNNKDGISVTEGSRATIEENRTENNRDNGIAIKGSMATIRNNLVRANHGIGVWLHGAGATAFVVSNTIDSNNSHGIGVRSGASADISGNTISKNSGAGIWMESEANVKLGENTFTDNSKGRIKAAE